MNQSERQRRIKKVVECNSKSKEVTIATSVSSVGLSGSHQTKSYSFDKVRFYIFSYSAYKHCAFKFQNSLLE